MINQQGYSAAVEEDYYNAAQESFSITSQDVREGFEDFIRVNFDETGFMSANEMIDQRRYVEQILATASPESREFQDLVTAYTGTYAEQSKSRNRNIYKNDVVDPLSNAAVGKFPIISETSYRKWINWIHDSSRPAAEKKSSIAKTLPEYLGKRRVLGAKRQAVIYDSRFKSLENSQDPKMKSLAAKITDNDYFLETLAFSEREDLLVEVLNALPLAEKDEVLFADFMNNLNSCANDKAISEGSKKKWIARFKDPSISAIERGYFVNSQFPEYVKRWRKVATERKKLKENPLLMELNSHDVKDLATFKDETKFLGLHYDKRKDLNTQVDNALTAKKFGIKKWNSEVTAILQTGAAAGCVSKVRIGALVAKMRASGKTVDQVAKLKEQWKIDRKRFDGIGKRMMEEKVPKGLTRKTTDQWLYMEREQRLNYLREAEYKLDMEKGENKHTRFQDLKGKVRHALDTEQWDEARMFLKQAREEAKTESEIAELQSMEDNLRLFGVKSDESPDQDNMTAMRNAVNKMDAAMTQVPDEVKPFYREAFKKCNAGCVRCLGVLLYNVWWCLQRGYLPQDLTKAKERAKTDTAQRQEPAGTSHFDGATEFNDIEGHGNSAIREGQWGPNVMCVGSSDASRVIESANANQNDFGYWYWGDLVVRGVSSGQYAKLGSETRKALTSGAYALEALGENYYSAKDKLGMFTSENAYKYN